MKKLFIGLVAVVALNLGCHHSPSSYNGRDIINTPVADTSHARQLLTPTASNGNATNPSMPDTIMTNGSPARRIFIY